MVRLKLINTFNSILHDIIMQDNYVDIIDDQIEYEIPHDCACNCDLCVEDYRLIMIEQDKIDKMSDEEIKNEYIL